MAFVSWCEIFETEAEDEHLVYKILDLTFLFLMCYHGVDHTLADSSSERRHLFHRAGCEGGWDDWKLVSRSSWMARGRGKEARAHLPLLGSLLILETSLKLSPQWGPQLWNEAMTYLIGTKGWLQSTGWKHTKLSAGCDHDAAQRRGPLVHGK